MQFEWSSLVPVIPEIFILSMACALLVLDLYIRQTNRWITYTLAQATLLIALVLTVSLSGPSSELVFNGMFVRDPLGDVLKAFVYLVTAGVFIYSKDYLRARNLFKGEFFILGLFAVLGMMILISARNFLTVYLGLELLALSLYAMVAFDRDSHSASEAAMKYFVLGALASGMLLYGISMIYGATGSLDLLVVAEAARSVGLDSTVLVFGLVFVVVGLAFKLGAVPFHMWVPDVYHGAPTAVTLFIGSTPKIAAFALLMRVLAEGLSGLHGDWQTMLVILAVLSMAVGNLLAIAQTNVKRMLAYSTISHVGFLLLGVLAGNSEGYAAAMFYTLIYALMALGAFGFVIYMSRAGFEADRLDDFKGLNDRSPWMAFIMLLLMFSMAGVPPTAGFFAKLFVLHAAINVDLVWVAVAGVFFSIIGAFYYIRIVKLMYFDKAEDHHPFEAGFDTRLVLSVNGLLMLLFGFAPSSLLAICTAAVG